MQLATFFMCMALVCPLQNKGALEDRFIFLFPPFLRTDTTTRYMFAVVVYLLSPVQLCNPMGCSSPCSSAHGILQARILEWVAMPSFRAIFLTQGLNLHLLCLLHWQAGSLPLPPPGLYTFRWQKKNQH